MAWVVASRRNVEEVDTVISEDARELDGILHLPAPLGNDGGRFDEGKTRTARNDATDYEYAMSDRKR